MSNYEETILKDSPDQFFTMGYVGIPGHFSELTDRSPNVRHGVWYNAGGVQLTSPTTDLAGDSDGGRYYEQTTSNRGNIPYYDPADANTLFPRYGQTRTCEMWLWRNNYLPNDLAIMYCNASSGTSDNGTYILWGGTDWAVYGLAPRDVLWGPYGNQVAPRPIWTNAIPAGPNSNGTEQWVHQVMIAADPGTGAPMVSTLYINGVNLGAQDAAAANSLGNPSDWYIRFGDWWSAGTSLYPWWGRIDNWAKYDYGLTDAQVLAHYNAGITDPSRHLF